MYSFEIVDIADINIDEFNSFEAKSPLTTIQWLNFLAEDNDAKPVVVKIMKGTENVGYFSGLVTTRFGIKIFGSPLKGWGTCYMGFDLHDPALAIELLEPVIEFVFQETKCLYFELAERSLSECHIGLIKHRTEVVTTLEINIDKQDEELLKSVKRDCKEFIRQFEKRGAQIEEAEPNEEFAKDLFDQLSEVFAKQNLVPTFSLERIKRCIKHLNNNGMLLCLTVKEPGGKSIASYIFTGFKEKCFAWCTGSYREYQKYRPNEYIVWMGLKKLRDRGHVTFDYAGVRDYKYKWNPQEVKYLRIMASKYPLLLQMRDFAKHGYWMLNRIKGIGRRYQLK